ncbi:MAG TPA: EVE domain-containing protein [Rhodospirillaceae bacterium]|nr:EVE domain-containing protein [Rhodospirillaceae bacterium]
MAYWLVKSEPSAYSWDEMVKDGATHWSGVRNFQAANNMKAMKKGDECFFYHSNEGKEIVGIVNVAKEYYPDPTDKEGRFGMVDVKAAKPLPRPVTLKDIKATKSLENLALVRQSRLSVCPVTESEWRVICKMGGL